MPESELHDVAECLTGDGPAASAGCVGKDRDGVPRVVGGSETDEIGDFSVGVFPVFDEQTRSGFTGDKVTGQGSVDPGAVRYRDRRLQEILQVFGRIGGEDAVRLRIRERPAASVGSTVDLINVGCV